MLTGWENLTTEGKQALKLLFRANERLSKAYLLQESFGQLWDYTDLPGLVGSLTIRGVPSVARLEPFQKFADMVEAHWDGVDAYCHVENKVPLGFVEGLNNRSVPSNRAYGYRDEEYFRLKILTCRCRNSEDRLFSKARW